jgi:hypothetical protein
MADQTAIPDGIEVTTFTSPNVSAKEHLVFTTGTSAETGEVRLITGTCYYVFN